MHSERSRLEPSVGSWRCYCYQCVKTGSVVSASSGVSTSCISASGFVSTSGVVSGGVSGRGFVSASCVSASDVVSTSSVSTSDVVSSVISRRGFDWSFFGSQGFSSGSVASRKVA